MVMDKGGNRVFNRSCDGLRMLSFLVAILVVCLPSSAARSGSFEELEKEPEPLSAIQRHPVAAVFATHHRSGTVLFVSIVNKLTQQYFVDFERIDKKVDLKDLNSTKPVVYELNYGATQRVTIGMHGFTETCKSEQDTCDGFDHNCRVESCTLDLPPQQRVSVPIVHVVRSPVAIIISSYLYHQQDPPPEAWLKNPNPGSMNRLPQSIREKYAAVPYYKVLQEVPPEDGLVMEYFVNLQDLYTAARNYRDMEGKPWALNIHFEDTQSNYNETFGKVLEHVPLFDVYDQKEIRMWVNMFDLANMTHGMKIKHSVAKHVTRKGRSRKELETILYNHAQLGPVLRELSDLMGYKDGASS